MVFTIPWAANATELRRKPGMSGRPRVPEHARVGPYFRTEAIIWVYLWVSKVLLSSMSTDDHWFSVKKGRIRTKSTDEKKR